MNVVREEINQQVGNALDEFAGLGERANVFGDFGMASGKRPEFGNEMRIGKKPDVE